MLKKSKQLSSHNQENLKLR